MSVEWYSVRVLSGKEKKVSETILAEAQAAELSPLLEQVLVPSENVIEMREGKKFAKNRVFFPGYVLLKMELSKEMRHFIENVPGIMSFVGPKGEPEPLKAEEVRRILGEVERKEGREVITVRFRPGDAVKITDGPFLDFAGFVQEVNDEKQKVKVSVSIFGRPTPVELDFLQVEFEK